MTQALAVYENGNFDLMQRQAKALAASNYFTDAKDVAQAVVKVMAGAELGLPPFASMTGIHIIQGKPALGANVIATLIKNDPRYDYRVKVMRDDLVTIIFFENGEPVGESSFSAEDAAKAQTKNMNRFPRNMLFARAISNGARWYTPGIFGGSPVYTPEELGVTDYDEDGYIIDNIAVEGEFTDVAAHTPKPSLNGNGNGHQKPPAQPEPVPAANESVRTRTTEAPKGNIDEFDAMFSGDNRLADLRAALETADNIRIRLVCNYAAAAGAFQTEKEAFAVAKDWPVFPENFKPTLGKALKNETAVELFNWLLEQSDEEE